MVAQQVGTVTVAHMQMTTVYDLILGLYRFFFAFFFFFTR